MLSTSKNSLHLFFSAEFCDLCGWSISLQFRSHFGFRNWHHSARLMVLINFVHTMRQESAQEHTALDPTGVCRPCVEKFAMKSTLRYSKVVRARRRFGSHRINASRYGFSVRFALLSLYPTALSGPSDTHDYGVELCEHTALFDAISRSPY